MDVTGDHHIKQKTSQTQRDKHHMFSLILGCQIFYGYIRLLSYMATKQTGYQEKGGGGNEGEEKENAEVSLVHSHGTLDKDCLYETTDKENTKQI